MAFNFPDISAMWPSKYYAGHVFLQPGGVWQIMGEKIESGVCSVGDRVPIDPQYPLYARYRADGLWQYEMHA